MTIYIGNLSYEVEDDDLSAVFAEYGTVKRVQLPTDRQTGRLRGFGFVEMSDDASEDQAIASLDGAEWMGRDLKVNKARPSLDGAERMGQNLKGNKARPRESVEREKGSRQIKKTYEILATRRRQVPKNLVLTIEVNENSSPDKVALEIANLCKAINAYHISCGGTGLAIDDWKIQVLSRELVEV
jgi:RNA recognition motif-containing protein